MRPTARSLTALRWTAAAVLAAGLLVATDSVVAQASGSRTVAADRAPHLPRALAKASGSGGVRVAVMTQNIFYGGDDYDLRTGDFCKVPNGCPKALHRLAHVIKVSGADVVGVQEAERNTRKLARLLGWHASPQAHVISRFPIIDPPHSLGRYTFVEPVPGRIIAVANIHLPSTPYGPYKVRKGWSRERVLNLENGLRLPAVQPEIKVLGRLVGRGIPVFLTGDFNSPSFLDWTPAVVKARFDVPYAVKWPASLALAEAGFKDSYRDVHPNPVKHPGYTWSPGGPETRQYDFRDRIDWVLHAGPSRAIKSQVVGERGNPDVDLHFPRPYPTDHRGVVSTFVVDPQRAPSIVSPVRRRVVIGDPLRIRFHHRVHHDVLISLQRDGGIVRAVGPGPSANGDGVTSIATTHLKPGLYAVTMRETGRSKPVARADLWLYGPKSRPKIATSASTYRVGDPIRVSWTRAPGENLDWIGLFPCGHSKCGGPGSYLLYRYTHTKIEGSLRFYGSEYLGEGSQRWPLPPGRYIARLLVDDSYIAIGKSRPFRVTR